MQRHIANILSLSRIPLGHVIYSLEVSGNFGLAFLVLVIGALTDAFDGWAARKFGTPTPKIGKTWIDPLSDAYLFTATVLGLIRWLPNSSQVLIWGGIPFVALWIALKLIKLRRNGSTLHRFANAGLPIAEWGGFWLLGLILAALSYDWVGAFLYLALTWPAVRTILGFKGFRVRSWMAGEA